MHLVPSLHPNAKAQFTEAEAAHQLGITIEHLRCMIRALVGETDGEAQQPAELQLQAADLVLLRMIGTVPDLSAAPTAHSSV